MGNPNANALGRAAKVLTVRHHSKIRRLNQLTVLKNRLEKIIKGIKEQLEPDTKKEMDFDGEKCTKTEVIIGVNLVELGRTTREIPGYKNICEKIIPEAILNKALKDPNNLTEATTYRYKSLGRAMNIVKVIPQEAAAAVGYSRKFDFSDEKAA